MVLCNMNRSRLTILVLFLIATLLLTACGGGGSSSNSGSANTAATSSKTSSSNLTAEGNETAPAVSTGKLQLEWIAPVARSDGMPLQLADIGGYRIYYGESKGDYPNFVDVKDGTAQAVTIKDLPVGTYFIVMTTYDVSGLESDFSSAVKMTIS